MDESDRRRPALFAVFLAVLMVSTGSLNTIAAKWADSIKVDGKLFNHPFVQAICMFIGEFSCLLVYFLVFWLRRRSWRSQQAQGEGGQITELDIHGEPTLPSFNVFLFAAPACCDIVGTSLMYIGLNMTQASSYQMLRGAVIIFTGLFSVAFLGSRLQGFRWLGMGLVTSGLVVVGVSDILLDDNPKDDTNAIITGDLLIVMAQIVVAVQMVIEQKFLLQYDVPALLAVGLEGLFGMVILTALLIPMYFIRVPAAFSTNPDHRLEDVFDAIREMCDDPLIVAALALTIVSIAFFNFAGLSVTKELSATSRMVLDSVRTLVIWVVSIPLFGQKFIAVQVLGFALLIIGMFVYNDLIFGPCVREKIVPRMGEGRCTGCCMSLCGIDLADQEDRHSLVDDTDD